MKKLVLLAALSVALIGCTTVPRTAPQASWTVPPPFQASPPANFVSGSTPGQSAQGPWRIRKTEWTDVDEKGFGEFIRAIALSGCTTTISCMQSAANFYHDSDPLAFAFHADCAKWVYMLRAYYASKNGLPFSYVSKIAGEGDDLRFSPASNLALERLDLVDTGPAIDTVAVLKQLHDQVYSATYRMDPEAQAPVEQDFYSPKIQPGSIRAGTAIYDITGHVMLVYDVTADGSILYMDAHPDESVTRGNYGAHVPRSAMALGGGFKNFRPLKLEGATLLADGTYVGGHVVLARNEAIADYSLEQYRGNAAAAGGGGSSPQYVYNGAPLDLYEYTRASMSKGGFAFNPVYEMEFTMSSMCRDAIDGSREAEMRVANALGTLYADLSQNVALWRQRDLRVVYHGVSLKRTLADTYAAQDRACIMANSRDGSDKGRSPLESYLRDAPEVDVRRLIASIDDFAPFAGMRPVGY